MKRQNMKNGSGLELSKCKKAKPAHWSGWPGGQRIQIKFFWSKKTPNYQWQPPGTTDYIIFQFELAI
jgi:hypothetical protein